MDIRPIKSEADYRAALQEIESLMQSAPGTPEGERLDVMVTLVEAYERVGVATGMRVLVLGAGVGREVAELELARGAPPLRELQITAIDHAPAAVTALRSRFAAAPSVRARVGDANDLGALLAPAERFDLAVAIGLLQSPGVDRDALLRELVKRRLRPGGASVP